MRGGESGGSMVVVLPPPPLDHVITIVADLHGFFNTCRCDCRRGNFDEATSDYKRAQELIKRQGRLQAGIAKV